MKVLLVSQHCTPSDGWGTLTRTTALGLKAAGHDVHLLLQKGDADLEVPQTLGLPAPLALLDNPLFVAASVWKIWRAIKAVEPDMVHVITEPYALAMPFVPSRHPWVMTGCGTYTVLPLEKSWTKKLLYKAYADMSYILAISEYTKNRILKELTARKKKLADQVAQKISVYTLGIEWPKLLPKRQTHAEKRIVFVGGVKERKGVREIVEACGVFKKSGTPFRVDIIGSCPENAYTKQLKSRIEELDLQQEVVLRGHVSEQELLQAYADADVFMMLSIPRGMHFEGYGLVFLEANAFGVPVIGPDDSGCTNAIEHGVSGFSVSPNDADAVAKTMERILVAGEISADSCIQWAKDHSVERQTTETLAIYEALL